ncbi:BNR repeat-containing protein [Bythopirellula polymerisocia]|nr:BNR repeat-containing protein [Bythopirellula polymerisocia]
MASILQACTVLFFCQSISQATAQLIVTPVHDMVLDSNALVMPTSGSFGRILNGTTFQQEALITHGGYQYTAWYHNGSSDEDIFVSRRDLSGTTWETIDTGSGLENGDATASSDSRRWDGHNSISLGISGDGRIHLSFDQHVDELRYLTTDPGFATSASNIWNQAGFKPERDALNVNGAQIPKVTYPRFTNVGDDLVFTYRDRVSQDGDHYIATYNSQTGIWNAPHQFTDGRLGSYTDETDPVGQEPSLARNAYLNGFDIDTQGMMHITWTWREQATNANHDINYAYSDDAGVTWKNNAGVGLGSIISLNSPGIKIVDLNYQQALINQQGQVVDQEGRVHALMRHRRQEPGFEWQPGDATYDTVDAAYHHYYRDPVSGIWNVNRLPVDEPVGSRPKIGVDPNGNLLGIYRSGRNLIVAGAEKTINGFTDWQILYKDETDYEGDPLLDPVRLTEEGILSVFLQERATTSSETIPTGSPLHVLEFNISEHVETTYYLQASHPGGTSILSAELWFDAPTGGTSLADLNGYFPGNIFVVDGLNARTPSTSGTSVFAGTLVLQGTSPQLINHTGTNISISRMVVNSDTLFGQRVDGQQATIGELELNAELLIRQQLDPGGDAAFVFDEISGNGMLKFGLNTQDIDNHWGFDAADTDGDFTGSILLDKGILQFISSDLELPLATLQILNVDANSQISLVSDATFKAFQELNANNLGVVTLSVAPGTYTAADLNTLFGTTSRFTGSGTLTVLIPGDFDGDGDVDGADFLEWQRNDGTPAGLAAWQSNYGAPQLLAASAATVPEPSAILLIVFGTSLLVNRGYKNFTRETHLHETHL